MRKTPWLDDILFEESGPKLTGDQEKRVCEMLGVSSAAPAVKSAAQAKVEQEFNVFEFLDDDEPARPRSKSESRRPAAKMMTRPKRPQAKSKLPLFIGGGSPRVLAVAGGHARIVGILASLAAGEIGRHAIVDQTFDRVTEKIGWVREAAIAAGRSVDDIRFEMNHWLVRVTSTQHEADELLAKVASRNDVTPELLASSPAVLVGTVGHITDALQERRERLGISCIQVDAGFAPKDLDAIAPIVGALAGR